jgi:Helix-turn-helix domain
MSVEAMRWVLRFDTKLTPLEQALAVRMADFAETDGTKIFPSVKTLCEQSGISRTSVFKILASLRAKGVLIVVEQGGEGDRRHLSTEYRMPIERTHPRRPARHNGEQFGLPGVRDTDSRNGAEGSIIWDSGGSTSGVRDSHPTTSLDSLLSVLPPLNTQTSEQVPPRATCDFEEWWKLYPRKVGKFAAQKAYQKQRMSHSAYTILDGLKRHKFEPEQRYQPHPTTWLNQGRFLDEVTPQAAPPAPEADPWGLEAWLAKQPTPAHPISPVCELAYYEPGAFRAILRAADLPEWWRGNLDAIAEWIGDGFEPGSIADAIGAVANRLPEPPSTLAVFNTPVRRNATRLRPDGSWRSNRQIEEALRDVQGRV